MTTLNGSRGPHEAKLPRADLSPDTLRGLRASSLERLGAQNGTQRPSGRVPGVACGDARGENRGYQRHIAAGEPACPECSEAHYRAGKQYRLNNKREYPKCGCGRRITITGVEKCSDCRKRVRRSVTRITTDPVIKWAPDGRGILRGSVVYEPERDTAGAR